MYEHGWCRSEARRAVPSVRRSAGLSFGRDGLCKTQLGVRSRLILPSCDELKTPTATIQPLHGRVELIIGPSNGIIADPRWHHRGL